MARLTRTLALASAFAALAGVAFAHPDFVSGNPAPNAAVESAPSELRLTFTEPLFVNFSGVKLTDARGKPVKVGKARLAPGDNKVLIVPLTTPLGPGSYKVNWHAVSGDTHRITGSYRFTVR